MKKKSAKSTVIHYYCPNCHELIKSVRVPWTGIKEKWQIGSHICKSNYHW